MADIWERRLGIEGGGEGRGGGAEGAGEGGGGRGGSKGGGAVFVARGLEGAGVLWRNNVRGRGKGRAGRHVFVRDVDGVWVGSCWFAALATATPAFISHFVSQQII